ncbi:MAG TPA: nicotinamide-nucleotide amidohydrolase family protein [Candidatus Accumulibacter phosphatis]|nr:MAG: Nicotinamide-nucleotide amidohydrolase PncC [Candidatus Accumulibacter sp. SK-11]HAY26516.1 damage-inducible protein CinA [Accumulibacter sp.]HRL76256.1 nicotinamide-nucleotide amidohydrolase family protein [Candidatus Accumulibacter phosphatis]HCN68484.1 nicotinamide-nucleotide amidohydrolase family protein [Accumulibacter sp.]HCV14683.1 nicotinamide-nucleotide amidohydrolase family protein [Accumulibacter sp.]
MSSDQQAMLETLAAAVGRQLLLAGERLVTAESCTGGWLAQCITAVAGSSGWFDRGFISYSNAAKSELLGLGGDMLAAHGAVSEATAAAMARGALARSPADWAVAITGIAGPDGGTLEKPVGTVCFAWAQADAQVFTATRRFQGDRRAVRAQSVECALGGLLPRIGRRSA